MIKMVSKPHKHSKSMVYEAYKLFFGTLTSKDRLLIINALRQKSMQVNAIAKETGIEQTRLSHNLRRMRNCGFVAIRQAGKYRIYSLNKETIAPLMKIIDKHMDEYCIHIVSSHHKHKVKE